MEKIRLFLLDDHQILLDGIKSLLSGDEAFTFVGEATRAEDALELIPSCSPDLVISDISLPEMNGIEFTKQLLKRHPLIKVMILTMSAIDHNFSDLLQAGVSGYILKNSGREELRKAILKISKGEKYFGSEVAEGLLRMNATRAGKVEQFLTPREVDVLRLITKEFSNKEIAAQLFISERTVETHRKNIFRKTNTKSVIGLLKWAQEHGMI